MTRANRNFADDKSQANDAIARVSGFNPGGEDFGVIRQVDGHFPYEGGEDGNNVHQPSGGSPGWNDPIGPEVE